METKYFVVEAYRYAASHKWEYRMVGMYDDIAAAKQSYHARMGAIIKASNDFVMVLLYDQYGNKIMSDYLDTYVEPNAE